MYCRPPRRMLPDPTVAVDAVVPFDRGDLVSRVYAVGTHVDVEHQEAGTQVRARVPADLTAAISAAQTSEAFAWLLKAAGYAHANGVRDRVRLDTARIDI